MKKTLLLVVLGALLASCDIIDRYPLEDHLLDILLNRSKNTRTVVFTTDKNEDALFEFGQYDNFRVFNYSLNWTYFGASNEQGEDLYDFTYIGGEKILKKIYSAKKIEYTKIGGSNLYVGIQADGKKEVFFGKPPFDKYDNIYPTITGFIGEKDGKRVIRLFDDYLYVSDSYDKAYVIYLEDWYWYCVYNPKTKLFDVCKMYSRGGFGEREEYYLKKTGYKISQEDINKLKEVSSNKVSEYSFYVFPRSTNLSKSWYKQRFPLKYWW